MVLEVENEPVKIQVGMKKKTWGCEALAGEYTDWERLWRLYNDG